jgi:16S rRNA (cytosine967-C5)-methyltransferase
MSASRLLDPQPGETVLDLCAAPGGKTTHLAELSRDLATIYAADVSEERLRLVGDNATRLQLTSIRPVLIGRDGAGLPDVPMDAALVDVPCSNSGVIARRPEARWRFREADLCDLTQLQTRLLMTAFDRLKPGGRLVYSTCSIEPEETTQLVQQVVANVASMSLETERLALPGQPSDGAYAALLRRAPATSGDSAR